MAWLYGIARNRLGRFFRTGRVDAAARQRLGMPERDLPPEDYERIEDLIDFAPIRDALLEALETLCKDQREAMRLRVIDGLGYPEVAERLRCTEANARQRVSRGLRKVAIVLQERGMQLSTEVEREQRHPIPAATGRRLRPTPPARERRRAARERPVRRTRDLRAAFLGADRHWRSIAAAVVALLVVAGSIGFLAQGRSSDDSGGLTLCRCRQSSPGTSRPRGRAIDRDSALGACR